MDVDNDPGVQTIITQGPNQVIHVRQDSASEMEALFNTVMNPNFKSKSLPMKARNLPKSFFVQPDRPRQGPRYHHSHSQSMGVLSSTTPAQINHSRSSSSDSNASHSSPAGVTTNVNNNNGAAVSSLVMRAGSPMNGNLNQKVGYSLSPAQRRAAAHNQFTSARHHSLQVPQVSHSRSKSSPASLQLLDLTSEVKVSDIPPDMPLPPGWSSAKTQDGQHYFMNHNDKSTTWEDPRIEVIKQQRENQFASMQRQALQNPSSQQPMHSTNVVPNELSMESLPPGWEQAMTPQGEVYYINHQTRSTSWINPTLQNAQQNNPSPSSNTQLQQQLMKINQMDIAGSGSQGRGGSVPPQQQSMIGHLVQEKAMMRRQLLKQQLSTGGLDPFLGGGGSNFHQRDASLDSGVGMGNNFNHPRTSEEFLNMEEMDTGADINRHLIGQKPPHMAPSTGHPAPRFPEFLDSLPTSSVDFSSPNTGNTLNQQQTMPQSCSTIPGAPLDGTDIVSSLQDTLSQVFDVESMLNHVKTENVDNSMIWL